VAGRDVIDAAAVRAWCHARAGVTEERPFGPLTTVFKVEGKVFALSVLERSPLELSLKCEPELAEALRRDHPGVVRPGYHLNKRHWNTVLCDGSLPDRMVIDMLEDSYDLVVEKLPRATQVRLGWSPGT
jgi:predicted DNA-binding protein (MmcQ/YjbR family)